MRCSMNPPPSGNEVLPAAIRANVWESIRQLLKRSAIVRGRVIAGKLKIVGAVYMIEDGNVQWLGPLPNQTQLLRSVTAGSGAAPGVPAAAAH